MDSSIQDFGGIEPQPRAEIDYMAERGRPRRKGERQFKGNRSWDPIIARGRQIALQFADVGIGLRQLHYVLASEPQWGYRNTRDDYNYLSKKTAKARREGTFPNLIDSGRSIEEPFTFESPQDATQWVAEQYRRDRLSGQEFLPFVAVEKATFAAQFENWFEDLGVPRVFCRGYSSQSYLDRISERVMRERRAGRRPVLLYGGDYDASGLDIRRHITEGTEGWEEW